MITIDDHTMNELDLMVLEDHDNPLLPTSRNKSVTIPGKHGSYDMGSTLGIKNFNIPLGIKPQSDYGTLRRKAEKFTRLLLDEYARPKKVKLRFSYFPDQHYVVKYSGSMPIQRLISMGSFNLPLIAHDPHAYSNVNNTEMVWGSEIITFEYDYLLGHKTHTDVNIIQPQTLLYTVQGLAIKPIIEIIGSADSLSIDTGDYGINLPGFTNDRWVIDCQKYTVARNGVDAFNDVKLREFYLIPGDNPVEITGNNLDLTIRITYRDKWM